MSVSGRRRIHKRKSVTCMQERMAAWRGLKQGVNEHLNQGQWWSGQWKSSTVKLSVGFIPYSLTHSPCARERARCWEHRNKTEFPALRGWWSAGGERGALVEAECEILHRKPGLQSTKVWDASEAQARSRGRRVSDDGRWKTAGKSEGWLALLKGKGVCFECSV